MGACAPSRIVKPLAKGEKDVSFSLGGPLIGFAGTTIPIPFTSLCGAYGVKENLTVFGSLHVTSLAYGVFQTDLGIVREMIAQKGFIPGISIAPTANLMFDKWESTFSFYPAIDYNFYWNYKQSQNYFYVGGTNWFELRSTRAHEETQQQHWIPAFQIGHTFKRPKMSYTIEAKYINPFVSNNNIIVDYRSFGDKGTIGIYIGISKRF
ncbi:MAG TPA: hypothetical protein DDX39_10685 [Bacteroidales bacterium]|nr:MAG: hypothetical protein A2W98_13080 [Bacteroidetes bacterium GWF2_33_38]HBF89097.1 hypothetical protein [Bacteroidales bacterium]